ncbi:MAG TPA: transketolase C-terminal domain-containing protein [Anaerovoracaceae bacterium]|nr:transketolase C-terminal domain-containing protein [Anaerovoracaceae bacterium]
MTNNTRFVSGDEAIAMGARLARPNVISAYPITPQTIVVERLSDYIENKSLDAEFLHVESEHTAMAAAMGVSSIGARAFTATSSQGLLHMAECLHYASGARFPIVMMNANRSLAVPWSIYGDQRDSLGLLDSGWIQVYCEDAQEALDMIIQAYKIAENPEVLTPFMVNIDGFVLTHTYEPIELPEQELVDGFLPKYETLNKMSFEEPKSLCFSTSPEDNQEFKYMQDMAILKSIDVIEKTDREYGDIFGRYYYGMTENYKCEDADAVIVTLGSVCGTVRTVIDQMRDEGYKVGLLKIRYMRPFPIEDIRDIALKVSNLGVLEKNISFGYEGTVYTNVNSALSGLDLKIKTKNYVGGFGGRDISKEDIREIYIDMIENESFNNRVEYIGKECEYNEL